MGVKVGLVPCGSTCNEMIAMCRRDWSHLTSKMMKASRALLSWLLPSLRGALTISPFSHCVRQNLEVSHLLKS